MSANHAGAYRHVMPLNGIIERRQKLAGRGRPRTAAAKPYKEKRSKRAPYNRKKVDETGKTGPEYVVQKSFWTEHKVSDMMNITGEELDQTIDKFMDAFIARQLKGNKFWNFPDAYKMGIDLRKFR